MKKIILIIVIIISLCLIGSGIFFTFSNKTNNKKKIVNVEKEIIDNDELINENIYKYRNIDDALLFLKRIHETEDVVVSYNDGVKATIKVFPDTDKQIKYTYFISGGDLLIE